MGVVVRFPRYDRNGRAYLTWRPVEVRLSLDRPDPTGTPVTVRVSGTTRVGGGRLLFSDRLTHAGAASIDVTLPANASRVRVWVGGGYPAASRRFGDVAIEVRAVTTGELLVSHPTMVRIRKNANALTTAERDRFLSALATLNGAGTGRFRDFRDMHLSGAPSREAHGGPGFLPWHRMYILDLERELQAIDGEVTVPYWRFDRAAPNVFSRSFMGLPDASWRVQFTASNPLSSWVAASIPGIERGRGVGPQTVPSLRSEAQTIAAGGTPAASAQYGWFLDVEGNPHGPAHTSHQGGAITSIGTAAQDPLFFLLHCNVDRLWAKWQWASQLHDPADPRSFLSGSTVPGHRLSDRLWPWVGPLAAPRPTTAPGGGLASSPMTSAPGSRPTARQSIDYLGTVSSAHHGFAYDDVPFQLVEA